MNALCSYFCLMNLSMALSTSSISIGIWGFVFRGLYVLFDSVLPTRFMCCVDQHPILRQLPYILTSTCALSHLSMLSDLTFEMCVPSLRWMAAHRMHRNMPSYRCVSI